MVAKGFAHEDENNLSVDWYTPAWIFERMGLQFDLDPCAPTGGVPWTPAIRYYDLEDNGLTSYWFGKVWLNPPYGKETPKGLAKMHQHRNGMALLFARTDCAWFHDSVAKADATLFLKGRVKFADGLGVSRGSGAGSGSMLIAWGSEQVRALALMQEGGKLVCL
jgi:hypothetical protein